MSKLNNGGPAFARPASLAGGGVYAQEGMSLRDYFAAKALNGLINYSPDPEEHASIAVLCYQLADAMLEARK